MADDPKLPVVMRPVLPNVLRLRSPEDVELEMRLLSATRLDAPEAIAEVQRIAAELAGMISVAEAADAVIAEAQSVNAALLRARKAAKRAKRLAAKAADDPERRVRAVDVACHMAGREPAKTDVCVDDIRPHLPKEDHHATVRELKEVLGEVKKRRASTQLKARAVPAWRLFPCPSAISSSVGGRMRLASAAGDSGKPSFSAFGGDFVGAQAAAGQASLGELGAAVGPLHREPRRRVSAHRVGLPLGL